MNEPCGCVPNHPTEDGLTLLFCPLHKSASGLLEALREIAAMDVREDPVWAGRQAQRNCPCCHPDGYRRRQ